MIIFAKSNSGETSTNKKLLKIKDEI